MSSFESCRRESTLCNVFFVVSQNTNKVMAAKLGYLLVTCDEQHAIWPISTKTKEIAIDNKVYMVSFHKKALVLTRVTKTNRRDECINLASSDMINNIKKRIRNINDLKVDIDDLLERYTHVFQIDAIKTETLHDISSFASLIRNHKEKLQDIVNNEYRAHVTVRDTMETCKLYLRPGVRHSWNAIELSWMRYFGNPMNITAEKKETTIITHYDAILVKDSELRSEVQYLL